MHSNVSNITNTSNNLTLENNIRTVSGSGIANISNTANTINLNSNVRSLKNVSDSLTIGEEVTTVEGTGINNIPVSSQTIRFIDTTVTQIRDASSNLQLGSNVTKVTNGNSIGQVNNSSSTLHLNSNVNKITNLSNNVNINDQIGILFQTPTVKVHSGNEKNKVIFPIQGITSENDVQLDGVNINDINIINNTKAEYIVSEPLNTAINIDIVTNPYLQNIHNSIFFESSLTNYDLNQNSSITLHGNLQINENGVYLPGSAGNYVSFTTTYGDAHTFAIWLNLGNETLNNISKGIILENSPIELSRTTGNILKVESLDNNGDIAGSISYQDNEWIHVVCVATDKDDVKLYLNGEFNSSDTTILNLPTSLERTIHIGGSSSSNFINGYIKSVNIWKRTLTTDDVKNLYDIGRNFMNIPPKIKLRIRDVRRRRNISLQF